MRITGTRFMPARAGFLIRLSRRWRLGLHHRMYGLRRGRGSSRETTGQAVLASAPGRHRRLGEEELARLVMRDSMIGAGLPKRPQDVS